QGGGQQGGGTATSTQTRLPSPSLEFMMIDQDGGRLLRGGILSDVIITPDTAINSLIVRAPARSMELVAALIEQLDRLPDVGSQIKVFTIVNGDATSLATTLQTLLGITTTTNQVTQTQGGLGITAQTLQAATAGGDTSIVPLRIAVDTRTNSIVATGSESDLNVIEVVLTRLDEEMQRRRLAVIRLRNTPAPNVAAAVTTYLTNQQTLIQQQLLNTQSISAYGRIEREVFVVAEEVSNSLIISASPQYFDEVVNMIQELDIRPPMVLVQVLIAEVRLDNIFEFGAEFGLQDSLVFDRGKALPVVPETPSVPGFNFGASPLPAYPNARSYQQETLAGQSITNFALGRTNGALGYGGLVLSAANESISILLRALQDDRRLQVLSRPQIMTMHNQPAYVQVGADVARISETTVTQNNVVISAPDRATGIILSILPLINDDGVVVLGVEAERSAVDNTTPGTQIGTDNNGNPITIPNVNLTRASTTISCTDGQTVVFAGLITNSRNVQLRRVPYLADVPVLGNLFQYQQDTQQRTELLIVMTPYIIRDDADAEMAKLRESERMSWCLSDVISVGGDPGLQGNNCLFCKTDTPVVYPDLDPTGSQAVSAPAMAKRDDPAAPTMATHGMAPLIPVPTPEILEPQPIPGAPAAVPVSNGGEHQLLPASGNYGPAPPAVNVAPANFQPANVKRLPAAN
ncbi:MAG: secretin N-terminal domain-containing protein, partial [Pirellulaceae bacterium]